MGYEIKLIVGKSGFSRPEFEQDMTMPFEDGSGYEYKRDDKGNYIPTGRNVIYFSNYAEIDLCKIGGCPLADLVQKTQKTANKNPNTAYGFFGTGDGNNEITQDLYSAKLWPVPVKEVLKALKESQEQNIEENGESYRRYTWAIDLLKSMVKETETIEVLFYGH